MPPNPKVVSGATAIVTRDYNNYLMVQRGGTDLGLVSDGYGEWCFPGGWIEHGENAHETAVRECMEETGIACRPIKQDGYHVHQSPSGFTVVTLFVICEYITGRPANREPDKALAVKWIPQDWFTELDLFFATDAWWRRPRDG